MRREGKLSFGMIINLRSGFCKVRNGITSGMKKRK